MSKFAQTIEKLRIALASSELRADGTDISLDADDERVLGALVDLAERCADIVEAPESTRFEDAIAMLSDRRDAMHYVHESVRYACKIPITPRAVSGGRR